MKVVSDVSRRLTAYTCKPSSAHRIEAEKYQVCQAWMYGESSIVNLDERYRDGKGGALGAASFRLFLIILLTISARYYLVYLPSTLLSLWISLSTASVCNMIPVFEPLYNGQRRISARHTALDIPRYCTSPCLATAARY